MKKFPVRILSIGFILLNLLACSVNSEMDNFQNQKGEEEHQKLAATISNMKNEYLETYQKSSSDRDKITILMKDFLDDGHYGLLGVYNSPEFSADFISAIQSGNLLVNLAETQPETRNLIVSEFQTLILTPSELSYFDQKAVQHFSFWPKF